MEPGDPRVPGRIPPPSLPSSRPGVQDDAGPPFLEAVYSLIRPFLPAPTGARWSGTASATRGGSAGGLKACEHNLQRPGQVSPSRGSFVDEDKTPEMSWG